MSIAETSLNERIKNQAGALATRFAVDRAVVLGIVAKLWQLVAGPVSLILVGKLLSPELQGFYYTFSSLLALQCFTELALSTAIVNLASHEWAHLHLNSKNEVVGSESSKSRLKSLILFILKWYSLASLAFLFFVGIGGFFFLSRAHMPGLSWSTQWFVLVSVHTLVIFLSPLVSLLEGCGQVATVNLFRILQAVIGNMLIWATLCLGGGLWTIIVTSSVMVLTSAALLFGVYRPLFLSLFSTKTSERMEWRVEIWPLQWRLATLSVFSYFIYSVFIPIVFYFRGPVEAGRLGMTLQMVSAVQAVGVSWVQARIPSMGMLIAQNAYVQLKDSCRRLFVASVSMISLGCIVVFSLILFLNLLNLKFAERLLDPLSALPLLLAAICGQVVQCQAALVRAFKIEPYVVAGMVVSIANCAMLVMLTRHFGVTGATWAYLVSQGGILLPWSTVIWKDITARLNPAL